LNVKRKQRTEWLLSFAAVQRWMGKETIKSSDTRDSYLYNLGLVCQRLDCTPDELVAQRIEDLAKREFIQRERLEEQIRQFRAELVPEGEAKAFMMVASLRSFLKANTGVSLDLVNTQPDVKHEVWMYDGEPSGEQAFWQDIVDHAPTVRDAAAFLIGLEAGARDGSVLAMTIGDVTCEFANEKAPYKIRIPPPGESPKKKKGGEGFIADDAKAKVQTYIALRRARGFGCQPTDRFIIDLETGRAIENVDALNEALRKAFLDGGALSHDQIYPPDARMSPVRWYALRKRAQTILEDNTDGTGIALNWVDVLMCHKPRGAQGSKYSRPTLQQLRSAYAKAMHRLEIYRPVKLQLSDDEIDRRVMARWNALGEKMAQQLQKIETRVVTGSDLARILRNSTTVEAVSGSE
jgi:hypothetical protein